MNNYQKEVLYPIKVPDSNFCFKHLWHSDKICPQYETAGKCKLGFEPEFLRESGNYMKDSACRNLLWVENLN